MEVYAPIAHRLGISEIKNELEDLSFMYLNREKYYEIAHLVQVRKTERDSQVMQMIKEISKYCRMSSVFNIVSLEEASTYTAFIKK